MLAGVPSVTPLSPPSPTSRAAGCPQPASPISLLSDLGCCPTVQLPGRRDHIPLHTSASGRPRSTPIPAPERTHNAPTLAHASSSWSRPRTRQGSHRSSGWQEPPGEAPRLRQVARLEGVGVVSNTPHAPTHSRRGGLSPARFVQPDARAAGESEHVQWPGPACSRLWLPRRGERQRWPLGFGTESGERGELRRPRRGRRAEGLRWASGARGFGQGVVAWQAGPRLQVAGWVPEKEVRVSQKEGAGSEVLGR